MAMTEVSETTFLLCHCRNELIRAWTAGAKVQYREWKRRKQLLRSIRETLETQ